MKIAFLTPEFAHPGFPASGGLGSSLANLVPALVEKGVEVTVFVYGQQKSETLEGNGFQIVRIANRKYVVGGWYFYRRHLRKYLNRILPQQGFDLIEVPDWSGITAFSRYKIPVVMRFHGSDAYFCHLDGRPQKWNNRWFEKDAASRADAFVAPTRFAGELSRKVLDITRDTHISVIHNGVRPSAFLNPDPETYEDGLLLYTGTVIRKKGVLELPGIMKEVWKKHPKARLKLIGADSRDVATGEPSTWELMRSQFSADQLERVSYPGKMPYSQMQHEICQAHVCLYPTFAETLGMVTIEAMAMEKPVVSSNFGWVAEIMEDGVSGFRVDPKDHAAFADRIGMLLDDAGLCRTIGRNARNRVVEGFDIATVAQQNKEFYKSLCRNGH